MSKLRKSARGQMCTLQIPLICSHDPEKTVLAHVGKYGSAKRNHDDEAVYACFNCHNAIDMRDSDYFLSNDPVRQKELRDLRCKYVDRALDRMRIIKTKQGRLRT